MKFLNVLKNISLIILLGLSIYYIYLFFNIGIMGIENNKNTQLSNLGQFYSGSIGLILNLLTICAVVIAYIAQRRQVNLQKEEILNNKLNNDIQNFENGFFQLLNIYSELTKNLEMHSGYVGSGKKVFKGIYKHFFYAKFSNLNRQIITQYENSQDSDYKSSHILQYEYAKALSDKNIQSIMVIFEMVENKFEEELSHYFRTVYHLMKYINEKKEFFDKNYKGSYSFNYKFYSNIFRAQLTSSELQILLYCCYSKKGKEKLLFLMKEFDIFEHINTKNLINEDDKKYLDLDLNEQIYNRLYDTTSNAVHSYMKDL